MEKFMKKSIIILSSILLSSSAFAAYTTGANPNSAATYSTPNYPSQPQQVQQQDYYRPIQTPSTNYYQTNPNMNTQYYQQDRNFPSTRDTEYYSEDLNRDIYAPSSQDRTRSDFNNRLNTQDRRSTGTIYDRSTSFNDETRPDTQPNQYSTQNTNQPADRIPDAELTTKVQDALKGGIFSKGFPHINIRVVNGVVSLSGTVEKEDDRESIRSKIRAIRGVRSIDDRIIVSGRQSNSQIETSSSPYRY